MIVDLQSVQSRLIDALLLLLTDCCDPVVEYEGKYFRLFIDQG